MGSEAPPDDESDVVRMLSALLQPLTAGVALSCGWLLLAQALLDLPASEEDGTAAEDEEAAASSSRSKSGGGSAYEPPPTPPRTAQSARTSPKGDRLLHDEDRGATAATRPSWPSAKARGHAQANGRVSQ